MFFKKKSTAVEQFNGNWEEPGVIGTRIEIENGKAVILWRNSPVLKTKFQVRENEDGSLDAIPDENGLRYENDGRVYATVTALRLKDDVLYFEEDFPISGISKTNLKRTNHSRYGNYTVVDGEVLPLLQGKWTCDDGFSTLLFKGDSLTLNSAQTVRIRVLKSNSSAGPYKIVNEDPSKYEVGHYYFMDFDGHELTAAIMICDAPPAILHFRKL